MRGGIRHMDVDGTESGFETHVLATCLEFGPRRGTPIAPRVREKFPSATEREIRDAVKLAERIQRRAGELTLPAWPLDQGDDVFRAVTQSAHDTLVTEFPQIDAETLSHAVSQAHYWHHRS